MFRLICLLSAFLLASTMSQAQDAPVALFADSVIYEGQTQLVRARGNVEVYFEGATLSAAEITYNAQTERLRATGPLRLETEDGTVFLADLAELSADLQEGLIQGARLLVAQQFQLAAVEAQRTGEGRFTTLYKTVGSACNVCEENPTPIWQIRAERVIQDTQEGQIYFEDAWLDVIGVPVFYLPSLRIADPSKGRASGLLVPELSNSDIYGYGAKIPYYLVIGDHADATFTPFLTSKGGVILETEYRQQFSNGRIDLNGAFAFDDGLGGEPGRSYIDATGNFALPREFEGRFRLNVAGDDAFLRQFGYSTADRLQSFAIIDRYRQKDAFELRFAGFDSLRDDEDDTLIPFVLPEISYRRILKDTPLGGRLGLEGNVLNLAREDGRNVLRFGAGVDWRRDWTLASGLQVATFTDLALDIYQTGNDPAFDEDAVSRLTPTAGFELRYPLARQTENATHVIEPIAQVLYTSDTEDTDIPNEDSLLPELDETSLFSLNRFPGQDVYEAGLRANLGISYTRFDPDGWNLGVTLGQVLRAEENTQFSDGTGLAGRSSDYVAAISFETRNISVVNRHLFDTELDFKRSDLSVDLAYDRLTLGTDLIFLAEDNSNTDLGFVPASNEFAFEATYQATDNWRLGAEWRYDLSEGENIFAEGQLSYGNECIRLDLSVSRRFTTSDDVPPSTDIGLDVRLAGIGGNIRDRWPADRCMRGLR